MIEWGISSGDAQGEQSVKGTQLRLHSLTNFCDISQIQMLDQCVQKAGILSKWNSNTEISLDKGRHIH